MRFEIEDQDIQKIAAAVAAMLAGTLPADRGKQIEDDGILDVDGLCLYLGMSRKWVYDRIAERSLPHFKLGHVLKFRKKDVIKWLHSFDVPAVRPATSINKLIAVK